MERRSADNAAASGGRGSFLVTTAASVAALLLLSGEVEIAMAAPAAGIVEGVIKDALGRPISEAQVRLEAPDGRVIARGTTGANGDYHFANVPAGLYSVIAEKPGFDTGTAIASLAATSGATADLTLAAQQALNLNVVAKQLEEARLSIEPRIGASTYTLSKQAIENQPGGDNNALNQVVLQAPGTTQDNASNGSFHVRNEHLGVQYRINGVILPEGVSLFGQGLTPRFVESLELITGALPAEYGLRTSGIVDIHTKSGLFDPGGSVGVYGGSYGTFQPSAEYGGSYGSLNYYVSGDYLQSNHGIEGVTRKYNQIHDDTQQLHGFLYLDKIIDATSKISFVGGAFNGRFQIPNSPGGAPFPGITFLNGTPIGTFDSATLNQRQTEDSDFGIVTYLRSQQDLNFQVSAFTKYSNINFHPTGFPDIAFNGLSEAAIRSSIANGLQGDASYKLLSDHTLRGGFLITGERVASKLDAQVLVQDGTDAAGNPTFGSTPATSFPTEIVDGHAKTGWTYSAYLQDEWKITPTVTLNYGGRFDVVNTFVQGNQLSPRANVVWQATPTTTFHAGYANYFTPPTFELIATQSINLFNSFNGNPAVTTTGATASTINSPPKIERAHYFDVGVAQQLLPGLTAGLDVYYKYSRNLVDEGQFGAPIVLTPFNYHVGYNKGVELTTTYDNGPFSFYGNLAIAQQKAEQINSAEFNFTTDDLAFIANNKISTDHTQIISAAAGVSYLWRDTRFSLDVIAGSGVRTTRTDGTPNGGTVPSYEQVNLGLSHRFAEAPGGPITVRFDLINVFDEVYVLRSGTGIGEFAPQFGPRRTVFAGVRKEF
jgi:outer membrane receptor protein involved in Fe transport